MIITTAMLLERLSDYKNPAGKLSRLVRDKSFYPIVKGLYETHGDANGYLLASSIYGPSYLSFDFALSYYGLIPEAVRVFTSATFNKKKKKEYSTAFGYFTYRDVPPDAYPLGIRILTESDYTVPIATPEKALCDKLYSIAPTRSIQSLLFEDLRIDPQAFEKLNVQDILILCDLYHCTNLKLLKRFIRRYANE